MQKSGYEGENRDLRSDPAVDGGHEEGELELA